jgi:transposase
MRDGPERDLRLGPSRAIFGRDARRECLVGTGKGGKTVRHRLNRGGDRAANSALHIIAIGRLRTDQRTKDYVARRIAEGHSKLDAIRALKRYLAREVFTLITQRRREINAMRIAA